MCEELLNVFFGVDHGPAADPDESISLIHLDSVDVLRVADGPRQTYRLLSV